MFNSCCTEISQEKLDRCFSVKQLLMIQDDLNEQLPAGKSWISSLSVDHFSTAIIAELGEILDQDSSPQWKWWKLKDPALYSVDMTKMEIVDIVHFWLSIVIIRLRSDLRGKTNFCLPDDEFAMYEKVYVGAMANQGTGIVENPNVLNHHNFMNLVRQMICGQREMNSYSWVNTLGMLASSMGMDCEELSAFYQCKATLNSFRWENPDWVKVDVEGQEDNERLFGRIEAFLADDTMTLVQLKQTVVDEFFAPPTTP